MINKLLFSDFNIKKDNKIQNKDVIKKKKEVVLKEPNNYYLYGSLIALGAIAFAGVYTGKNLITTPPGAKGLNSSEKIKKTIYNAEETLKYDKEYRKKIVKGLEKIFGIKKEIKDIKSIMGKEEFQKIISTYPPESFFFHQDSFDFMSKVQIKRGIQNDFNYHRVDGNIFYIKDYDNYMKYIRKNLPDDLREEYYKPLVEGKYRVCLLGMIDDRITDPRLVAETLLNQAVQYADKVAKKVNDGKPPFIITIKDTSEVQREIVKKLSENPEKYKNLKVVLRSEYYNKLFINPFDKGLMKEEKIAGEKFMEGLKQLFKHMYALPKEEKIYQSNIDILNDIMIHKDEFNPRYRLLDDSDWEKVLNNPNRIKTRNKQKNTWEIYNSFLDLYRRPFYNDELRQRQRLKKIEKTAFQNFLNSALISPQKEILPPEIRERFLYLTSDDYIVPIIKQDKIAGCFEDAVEIKNEIKEKTTKDVFAKDSIDFKYMSPKKLATIIKNEKFYHEGDTKTNPIIFIDNYKNRFHLENAEKLIKEIISQMFEKGDKEIYFAEEMYNRGLKIPAQYIFGDDICITDKLWEKIIS